MNIWFTADTHFGHANIIKYCARPFKNAQEMDDVIINNWNQVVVKDDLVFHLGDFSLGSRDPKISQWAFDSVFNKLNGMIILIKGNHDITAWRNRSKFYASYDSYHETEVKRQDITLCHYPMFRWNKSHHMAWMLHGHCHYTIPETRKEGIPTNMGLILDVGVDGNNFTPYSFEQIKEIMDKKRHYIEETRFLTQNERCNNIHDKI